LGGQFTENDVQSVWIVLLGYGISLVASSEGRLFNSAFYAMKNTQTPLKISILQVVSSTFLGLMGLFLVTQVFQRQDLWTPVVLTLSSSVASWIAWFSARRNLNKTFGAEFGSTKGYKTKLILIALGASFLALGVKWGVNSLNQWVSFSMNSVLNAFIVLTVFGLFYLWFSVKFKLTENVRIRF
ncbi:MAG TPA: lipid II flippase MurJ, partial [Pseudobdellovibrionaceae bacterium]|nr:lipid II flippase MurJ [Pseudobdellovibrionaceae bacterium]